MKKTYNRVLTIAGSDSGGGAGIQADIKAISAMGCYAASAITAVTVQNTIGVQAVHPVPLDILEGQIDAVLSDIGADSVKIGMLHSAEVVNVVARMTEKYEIRNVILDPVMVSLESNKNGVGLNSSNFSSSSPYLKDSATYSDIYSKALYILDFPLAFAP